MCHWLLLLETKGVKYPAGHIQPPLHMKNQPETITDSLATEKPDLIGLSLGAPGC